MSADVAAPATPPVAAPALSDRAETVALIQQIANEARTAKQTLVFDPDAPEDSNEDVDSDTSEGATERAEVLRGKPKPKVAKASEEPAEGEEGDTGDTDETETEEGEETEEQTPAGLNPDAVKAALEAEGGVDMVALAEALGVDPEKLKVTPGVHKAIRLERRKAKQTLERAEALANKLKTTYGDQVAARKAAATGELNPAIEFIENTFGMSWNELNRAVADLLQGKPVKDMEQKREFRELKKREAEREQQAAKEAESKALAEKTDQAKLWITSQIKGDKLASPEFNKLLSDAGYPSVTELVFEEMQKGYSKGLTDPKKALEKVRVRLEKQAKALSTVGLVAAPKKPKVSVNASRPRESAQAGIAGAKSREMTDREMREAVLKEVGMFRR